jgi:murein DD-endopeptidase MepM/ murein hydrolase activator NlpD
MKKSGTYIAFSFLCLYAWGVCAQEISGERGDQLQLGFNDAVHPCISPEQYKVLEKEISDHTRALGISFHQKRTMSTTFNWPLRMANGLNDCSYYFLAAYVDQDTSAGNIKDWNCGTNTYDGHRGNDIATFPYPFYKMDNNLVEVIAAAPGTIVNKVDGNFDKNCAMNNSTANYIVVQHADGSVALYWHMKINSLTSKAIGQTVTTGEFLGIVGSSGDSGGPHLHFEVWSGVTANTLKDVNAGTCNLLNANSLWVSQKPYTEPAVVLASVQTVAPVLPSCPATETPNEDTCFTGGSSARFYFFMRNETAGTSVTERMVNPNGTTFGSIWTHNCVTSNKGSYYYFIKTLPTVSGTYAYEVTYNGQICSRKFIINCLPAGVPESVDPTATLRIFPNPSADKFSVEVGNLRPLIIQIYNVLGELIYETRNSVSEIDLSSQPKGYYNLRMLTAETVYNRKLILK